MICLHRIYPTKKHDKKNECYLLKLPRNRFSFQWFNGKTWQFMHSFLTDIQFFFFLRNENIASFYYIQVQTFACSIGAWNIYESDLRIYAYRFFLFISLSFSLSLHVLAQEKKMKDFLLQGIVHEDEYDYIYTCFI